LRAAISDRLRQVADRNRSLQDLLRQFAYDRLLYRVFTAEDSDRWVLKGATALLARLGGEGRHTVDVDLYNRRGDLDEAERALRAAANADVGDYFRFELSPGRRIAEGGVACRVRVACYLGATEFARFNVDLVAEVGMTGTPEPAESLVPIEVPGIARATYRLYPLADHVADKVLALIERHPRHGTEPVASTRYRDLADLVLIARRYPVDADDLSTALHAQARRRGIELPSRFSPPTGPAWSAGYRRVARDVPDLLERDVDSAIETARTFMDPILQGRVTRRWDPQAMTWR
jgi:hypothetical protein